LCWADFLSEMAESLKDAKQVNLAQSYPSD
jgi:hypothetical protein